MDNKSDQFKELNSIKTEKEVRDFIAKYGANWVWKPIGGRENAGTIEMGSEPSDALAERITNGIDALIERKYIENGGTIEIPKSPGEAVEKWFKIPNGDVSKLNEDERRQLAKNLSVTLLESGDNKLEDPEQWEASRFAPTIEIRDNGIGQHPEDFEKTFVSLNEDYKMGKHFLMGAFGQGGSTVYGFGTYSIIISRRPISLLEKERSDEVGWTIIRRNERGSGEYKKCIYEYCTSSEGRIMRFSPKESVGSFEGAIIRLIRFELPQESTIYTAPTGSLWWLSHHCLFEPVLPFLICDGRKMRFPSLTEKDLSMGKVVNGNRLRLSAKDKTKKMPKYDSNSWQVNLEDIHAGKIEVTWWVCENKDEVVNFVNKSQPIVITYNGQRQITVTKAELTLRGRDFVKDRLVVQVRGDGLSPAGQRIFSSTRDRAKKNQVYSEIVDRLRKALLDDEDLRRLDQKIKEKVLAKQSSEQEKKAMELLEKLLERQEKGSAGDKVFNRDASLPVTAPPRKEPPTDDAEPEEEPEHITDVITPVTTNEFPTKIEILNAENPIRVEKGRGTILKILLDATDEYLVRENNRGELKLSFKQEGLLSEKARSGMRNGRIGIRIESLLEAKVGASCEADIEVTGSDMKPIVKTIRFEIQSAKTRWRLKTGKKEESKHRALSLKLIAPGDAAWEELKWDESDVAEYNDNVVFVSKANRFVSACLRSAKVSETTMERYLSRYAAHIALFTILQKRNEDLLKQELPEGYQKTEKERAARAIINAVAINIEELDLGS